MCVSLHPAHFSATVVCLSEGIHPRTGRPVLVLIYANTAQNLSSGANALLLHIPASLMDPDQVIDTSPFPSIAQDLVEAVTPRFEMRSLGEGGIRRGSAAVFDRGMYTCVLAKNARDIPDALARVPDHKRPPAAPEIYEAYDRLFPDYMHLLCCFSGRGALRPDPIMCYYEPIRTDRIMLPALDSHTGHAPDLKATVDVDHWGIVGAQERRNQNMMPVGYRESRAIPADVLGLLPRYAMGRQFRDRMPNGDFIGDRRKVFAEGPGHLVRGLLNG